MPQPWNTENVQKRGSEPYIHKHPYGEIESGLEKLDALGVGKGVSLS